MFKTRNTEVKALREAVTKLQDDFANSCRLIAVDRDGSSMVLSFIKGGEIFKLETYATMGMNIDVLRAKAGLK